MRAETERNARIIDAVILGAKPAIVAERAGMTINAVYCVLQAARNNGIDIPPAAASWRPVALRLARYGLKPKQIEQVIDVKANTISAYLYSERKKGVFVPIFAGGALPEIPLSVDMEDLLKTHAGARGLTSAALKLRILETVVQSDLIDAVLDDMDGTDD